MVKKSTQKHPTDPVGTPSLGHIHGVLNGVEIGRLVAERPVTGEADHPTILLEDQDRMSLVSQPLKPGGALLESDRLDVIGGGGGNPTLVVDLHDGWEILMVGGADHTWHGFILELTTDPATTSRSQKPKNKRTSLTLGQEIPIPTAQVNL